MKRGIVNQNTDFYFRFSTKDGGGGVRDFCYLQCNDLENTREEYLLLLLLYVFSKRSEVIINNATFQFQWGWWVAVCDCDTSASTIMNYNGSEK